MGAVTMEQLGRLGSAQTGAYLHPDIETLPRERLAALQLERLQDTVANAWAHVPLHRGRLDAAGARPGEIRSLDDLQRLPFTLKTDLRDEYPFGLFARPVADEDRGPPPPQQRGNRQTAARAPQDAETLSLNCRWIHYRTLNVARLTIISRMAAM